jgi:hypothetical protein
MYGYRAQTKPQAGKMWRGVIMKMRKYRRKRVSKRALVQVQAMLVRLSPEQTERLERHRGYLEAYWNSPVSPAEAFLDVVGLNVDRRARS